MNWRVALLAAAGAIQLAAPGWMVFEQEQILRRGAEYKFETEPVDPYDLFRGRYVALQFKAAEYDSKGEPDFSRETKVYVAVKPDAGGFAQIERISGDRIAGDNVFRANVLNEFNGKVYLQFPFQKFFMGETVAPKAEKAYRKANQAGSKQKTWALVRLRGGKAALADLVIDGEPIRDYVRTHSSP